MENASDEAQDDHAGRPAAVPGQPPGEGAQADRPGQRLRLLRGGPRPRARGRSGPAGVRGVIMGSTESPNRMALAVPDTAGRGGRPAALLLPEPATSRICSSTTTAASTKSGSPSSEAITDAPISLTFTVEPKAIRYGSRWPWSLDFPEQVYIDGTKFERNTSRASRTRNAGGRHGQARPGQLSALVGPDRGDSEDGSSMRSRPAPPTKATGPAPCA